MGFNTNEKLISQNDIWIISGGKYVDLDMSGIVKGITSNLVREYRISDLARYLLDPNPIEIRKKLIGCEVHFKKPFPQKIKEKIGTMVPKKIRVRFDDKTIFSEVFISRSRSYVPCLKDRYLTSHINKVNELLRPYDPALRRLSKLDITKIFDVTGICEEIGDNRSVLKLKGSLEEKINYIWNFISKDVGVVLEKAHLSQGLFEMRGFDFKAFDAKKSYRLLKLSVDGKSGYCVLNSKGEIDYWVNDGRLVAYMHLLEQSIQKDAKFADSINLCVRGEAKPVKLFFNKQFEIDYSENRLPDTYKEVFKTCNMAHSEQNIVMDSLNNLQYGIAFNCVPVSDSGEEDLIFNIAVMHDVKALEPIKADFPGLYSEIAKRSFLSEAGKFYLLDSIRGHQNE